MPIKSQINYRGFFVPTAGGVAGGAIHAFVNGNYPRSMLAGAVGGAAGFTLLTLGYEYVTRRGKGMEYMLYYVGGSILQSIPSGYFAAYLARKLF